MYEALAVLTEGWQKFKHKRPHSLSGPVLLLFDLNNTFEDRRLKEQFLICNQ